MREEAERMRGTVCVKLFWIRRQCMSVWIKFLTEGTGCAKVKCLCVSCSCSNVST